MTVKELSFNKDAYKDEKEVYAIALQKIDGYLNKIKAAVKKYMPEKSKEVLKVLNMDMARVTQLFANQRDFDNVDKVVEGILFDLFFDNQTFGGLPVNKHKAFELIDMPDGVSNDIAAYILRNQINHTGLLYLVDFELIEIKAGKAALKAGFDNRLREKHTITADNEQQLERYEDALTLKSIFDKYQKRGQNIFGDFEKVTPLSGVSNDRGLETAVSFNWVKQG